MKLLHHLTTLVLVLLLFVGVGLIAYPFIGKTLSQRESSAIIQHYTETVEELPKSETDTMLKQTQAYNRSLNGSKIFADPFSDENSGNAEAYESMLNLDDGLMGYIEIPKIDVYLPIYHGTTKDVLNKGIGHLYGTSLPVGGSSTHAVLAGHTGISGKVLFDGLPQMEKDDLFAIHVLGKTLMYQVDRIEVIEPKDTELLQVVRGKDYVTLMTCTPYGVNTHRLLVRGVRVMTQLEPMDGNSSVEEIAANEVRRWTIKQAALLFALAALFVFWRVLVHRRKKRKNR